MNIDWRLSCSVDNSWRKPDATKQYSPRLTTLQTVRMKFREFSSQLLNHVVRSTTATNHTFEFHSSVVEMNKTQAWGLYTNFPDLVISQTSPLSTTQFTLSAVPTFHIFQVSDYPVFRACLSSTFTECQLFRQVTFCEVQLEQVSWLTYNVLISHLPLHVPHDKSRSTVM